MGPLPDVTDSLSKKPARCDQACGLNGQSTDIASGFLKEDDFPFKQGRVMLSDSSLRTRVVYDIAVRYMTPLWRIGAAFRGACAVGLWLLLPWFPATALPRTAAQMLMVSAGVTTAWIQTMASVLDQLASGRVAPVPDNGGHL